MSDKLEKEINLYDKIIVKNYNDLSLAEQFEKGVVVKVDDELERLKQQLAIAVEALEKYADLNNWHEVCDGKCTFECISGTEDHLAQQALQKIKELNK